MSVINNMFKKYNEAHFLMELDFEGFLKRYAHKDLLVPNEQLGSECVTNGDNEVAKATFDNDADEAGVSVQDGGQAHGGSYSTKLTSNGTQSWVRRYFYDTDLSEVTGGKLYKLMVWVYLPSGQGITNIQFRAVGNAGGIAQGVIGTVVETNRWQQIMGYVSVDTQLRFDVLANGVTSGDVIYFDDLSVKEVIDQSGRSFEGKIINELNIGSMFDMRVPRYSAPCVMLTIANDDRLQDYEKRHRIEMGVAKIWLWSPGLDWADIEDYPIFWGICRKNNHTKDYYVIELIDIAGLKGEMIDVLSAVSGHAVDNIKLMLRQYTDLRNQEIDYQLIETMRSILPGYNFSTKVETRVNAFDVVDRICSQLQAARIQRFGKVGAIAFDLNGPSVGKIMDGDILERSTIFRITPRDIQCNSVLVQYNPSGGSWSNFILDRTNNDLCRRSYYEVGELPQGDLMLGDVTDESVARGCANRFLEWRAFRRDLVEIPVPNHVGWDFLEGDVGELTIEDGASKDGNGWVSERCILLQKVFCGDFVNQLWMRVGVD